MNRLNNVMIGFDAKTYDGRAIDYYSFIGIYICKMCLLIMTSLFTGCFFSAEAGFSIGLRINNR